ncbi:MAG: hypothetical protein PHQ52_02110 [Candidatus Omnitrophica bacterium]|nr:hypothetical protein [Candidatus Omnitrophota bacterium]
MSRNLLYLFIYGIVLGAGPCLGFCIPILVPYFVARQNTLKESLKAYLVFSFWKIIGYIIFMFTFVLGLVFLQNILFNAKVVLAFFLIFLGITIMFMGKKHSGICNFINSGKVKNVGLIGILIGLSPCLPLIGIADYVSLIARTHVEVLIYAVVFGIGTTISPVIFFVLIASGVSQKIINSEKRVFITRIIVGIFLVILGSMMVFR